MVYTAQMAAALSGATRRQLSHWRRDTGSGALLVPEISAEPPRVLYSFRDLLALRSCVFLRQNVSLQKIRKAISNLRDLGEREHLSQYTLVSDGDTIVLVDGEDATDLVRKPGQRVLAVLSDVFEPFAVREGVVVPGLFRPRQRLEVDPAMRGGCRSSPEPCPLRRGGGPGAGRGVTRGRQRLLSRGLGRGGSGCSGFRALRRQLRAGRAGAAIA